MSKLDPNLLPPTEHRAPHILNKGTVFIGRHFETLLLWKHETPPLPLPAIKHFELLEKGQHESRIF